MDIQYNDNAPIYIQIINQIKMDICSSKLQKGDKMPSVRELAVKAKVNPNTVQRVYQELEREGLTVTQRGTGTYVTHDETRIHGIRKDVSEGVIRQFVEDMERIGYSKKAIIKEIQSYLEE